MGFIRPLVRKDLPQIVDLYTRVFRRADPFPAEQLTPYFAKIFLESPWIEEYIPSLVYEENQAIVGFLGVVPRRMWLGERHIRMAVSNHFMVDASHRSTLAGIELIRTFFAGPQELSFAEGGDISRRIWERLGGFTSLLYSMHWTRPLRPASYVASHLLRREAMPPTLARLANVLAWPLDKGISWIPGHPFRPKPQGEEEELTVEMLLDCLSTTSKDYTLRPSYDLAALKWLLDVLSHKKRYGQFKKTVVRKAGGEVAGWYLYYANPGGLSEVLQIGAQADSVRLVLDHLIYHAWQQGALALTGRIEPKFMDEFSDKYFLFHRGDLSWALVHSRHPEVLEAIHRGEAFLTRVEGEWWITFGG